MACLADRLDAAERAGDKVWPLTHIPPGADAYATLASGGCRLEAEPWPCHVDRETT
jgi:hypothetical protein